MSLKNIETIVISPQLKLTQLKAEHAPELFELTNHNRKHLKQFLPWLDAIQDVDDSLKFIQSILTLSKKGAGIQYGVYFEHELIGVVGFNSISQVNRIGCIGYWLSKNFCGKGIMQQSVQSIVEIGFSDFKLNKIKISCATQNKKSRSIPERLGFKEEAILMQEEWLYDHFVDHIVYAKFLNN